MRYPQSFLDEIRARLPVSEVVRRRVTLKKAGREWRGLSPFNPEKTPSFFVNDQKGFYHCFSSGKHGDQFRFLMETEGLSFRDAAERFALKEYLGAKSVPVEDMVEAGLLVAGDDIPLPYDRFRERVMFPIADFRGRIVAFGGRALDPDAPAKYLNSPETPLFRKGGLLYNGAAARAATQKGASLIVVEGYVDAIAMVSAGFEATVAPLGTALTEDQLILLWRMAEEPILCFDGDAAGRR